MFEYLYRKNRWKRIRLAQLRKEPLCAYCLLEGRTTAATIADHIIPHKGNEELFWKGKLQSLCIEHHNGSKQREEARGRGPLLVGPDGYAV